MKTKFSKQILTSLLLFFCLFSNAQTVSKTFTVIPFVDLNNNCIYDFGEDSLIDFKMQINDNVTYFGAGGTSFSNGKFTGTVTVPSSSPNYSVMLLQGLIQPCALASSGNIPYFTVYHLPINPVILNAPVAYGSTIWSPIQGKIFKYAPQDTLKYCSGSLFAGTYNSFIEIHNNVNSVAPAYTGTMTVKLDQATVDTYSFSNISVTTPFTSASSSGTILSNTFGQALMFKYNLPNTPVSAGIHTLSLEFSPFTGYTQPTVIKMILNTDSCGSILGQTYLDCNNNCTKDVWETYGGNNISSVVITNSTNTVITYPSSNGLFSVNAPIGIYTVTANGTNSNYSVCPTISFTTNITYASTYSLTYGVKELSASAIDYHTHFNLGAANPGPGAVPGGTLSVTAYNKANGGPLCVPNPTLVPASLKVVLPIELSYLYVIGATPMPSSVIPCPTGDTIVWNNPGLNTVHKFAVYTATNAVIGNMYCLKSIVYPLVDINPSNNTYTNCYVFGGPFDPNEKTAKALGMFPNGNILPNTQDIVYTIDFQNLGNGSAVNVNINDTIDSNLDLSTLEIISSSYPVQTQINMASRAIDFKFKGIYLVSSQVDEPASHGYVRYKINLNPGLPLGTSIKNRAHIYFDYNSAITTNKTVNTIAISTGINESELSRSTLLYPNPTNGAITIKATTIISHIEVLNVIGQTSILSPNVNAKSTVIDLSNLDNGVYFIQLHTTEGIVTKKIVKK